MILLHYLVIQLSILLFMAPYYLLYRRQHGPEGHALPFSETLEYFFSSKYANWMVFAWAALEALVWFVIPEFLLLLLVFMRIRKKRQLLIYDILGTALGTMIAFLIPAISPQTVAHLPYITAGMVAQTQVWYDQLGMLGLLLQPFSGVPYKVFTLSSHGHGYPFVPFLLLALVVRISRYWIFYLIFTGIYPFLHRYVYRNYVPLFFAACAIFTLALTRVYGLFGPGYALDYKSGEAVKHLLYGLFR